MSNITASPNISQVEEKELPKFLELFCSDVTDTVNGGLDFQTNFNCKLVSVTFSATNTDTAVAHGLGRAPAGAIRYGGSAAGQVYDGSVAPSANLIYLKCTAAGTANLIVF